MTMVTSRDIQEIVSKLSSDKAKNREEGIKLLNSWLEQEEKSAGFCKFLAERTAPLKLDQIPSMETWPFLITLLIKCITSEISSSKRRPPKLIFAKVIRNAVHRAESAKFTGKRLFLLCVVKLLFSHIWDVLNEVPSFQSDYGIMLRHLLTIKEYCFLMRKKVYCSLVCLYMERIKSGLDGENNGQHSAKEEAFRCVVTLHSLLEHSPGDFPENLREDIVKAFIGIFSILRDEGKISRKLVECLNTYLSKDGPNLGSQSLEVHNVVQKFVFRYWLTTHDRVLKDALIFYAKLQINLTRGPSDGSALAEQFLDVVSKELDHSACNFGGAWSENPKDDKLGTLTVSQSALVELAALIFYRACGKSKTSLSAKRAKKENAVACLNEGLAKGKALWNATFCCFSRKYRSRISKDFFQNCFEGICTNFERILNYANMEHSYDGLLWTLRSLQEMSSLLLFSDSRMQRVHGWTKIWNFILHRFPAFSNVTPIADASLILLGSMISNDLVSTSILPQDAWDLQFFKHLPSVPLLYFISCYFSRRGAQGGLRENLHFRLTLITAVFELLHLEDSSVLSECLVVWLPAAIFALCVGYFPFPHGQRQFFTCHPSVHHFGPVDDWVKEGQKHQESLDVFECCVDVLAQIDHTATLQVAQSHCHQSVWIPRQLREPLLHEMETYIFAAVMDKKIEKLLLSDVFFLCTLISNFVCYSYLTRPREGHLSFMSKMCHYMLKLLDVAISLIQENWNDICCHGCLSMYSLFDDMNSIIVSFKCFSSSPLYHNLGDQDAIDAVLYAAISKSMEKLLKAITKLYEEFTICARNLHSEFIHPDYTPSPKPYSSTGSKSKIVDVDLDACEEFKEGDAFGVVSRTANDSTSTVKWKLNIISLISNFFSFLPVITWETLFDLEREENDPQVRESILHILCQHPQWPSSTKLTDMVKLIIEMVEVKVCAKLDCLNVLAFTHTLLGKLLSLNAVGNEKYDIQYLMEGEFGKNLMILRDMVNKIAELGLLDCFGRIKLIDCICDLILLNPQTGQIMIQSLLMMLHDRDYRVRIFLARRIGVLFQTWDGHDELLQDICSNFGVKLVVYSKSKLVTAREVLTAGPQSQPVMETVIVTLMHIAFNSEKIELEAVFMMSVICAIDPSQRELVKGAIDNLSGQLHYTTRSQYLEELMGSILFCWVNCGVSLVALVEIRDLFILSAEPNYFMQYCCQWILPALILQGDILNLKWVAKVTSQPLADLVKDYFVQIFSICIALHCSKKPRFENGLLVLQNSLLHIAEISENERDKLIKKHMVSIVSNMFSLASCTSDSVSPFFSKDTVVVAIKTVVDGFLEMEETSTCISIIDKINIFRPDRVFMFIVELHYKIVAAVHYRHRCHRLAGVEALINILGPRAAVSSTCNYLFNLAGKFISCVALQDQCCRIISALLQTFKSNLSKENTGVLGAQLQFLVSKLVSCYIPPEGNEEVSGTSSLQVLSLLHELIVDSDPSLHAYVRGLEPLPELDVFDGLRTFHGELCHSYCPRDHFLKFLERSCYLPPRIFLWSLKALHKKLLVGEIFSSEENDYDSVRHAHWHCNINIANAVWKLVRMCGSDDANSARVLLSDFISRVGIGDPHSVVFRIPGKSSHIHVSPLACGVNAAEHSSWADTAMSEELLIALIRLLKKYLLDDAVDIVDIASQALRGILSTQRGQRALLSFESYERSIIEVHSKGISSELIEKLLLDLKRKFDAVAVSLEDSTVWKTHEKTFEMWISSLVYSLITYCDDTILRLCQDIVSLKAEVAELLLPPVFINLAGRKDLAFDLHKLISSKLQENIFIGSNKLIKSIQIMLNVLNELRLCYVMERVASTSKHFNRESLKYAKHSSSSSKSRSASAKSKIPPTASDVMLMSTSLWDKVYWLPIDYLVVAKSALLCGSYFTSAMYVEYWCEEHFGSLTIGSPDFSYLETLSCHIDILVSAVTQINEPDSLYGIIQSHKLTSQIITFEHEGNWGKALEYYDLLLRSEVVQKLDGPKNSVPEQLQPASYFCFPRLEENIKQRKPCLGLIRSLQRIGCTHVLDMYCQGLTSHAGEFQNDLEFTELQYEAAWRAGNWDYSSLNAGADFLGSAVDIRSYHINETMHSCLRALQEGESNEFHTKLNNSKQELVLSLYNASEESTEFIYSAVVKLQILDHLGMAWDLRWTSLPNNNIHEYVKGQQVYTEPIIPTMDQLSRLNKHWTSILQQTQLHMNLLEPFIAFRKVLLHILGCKDFAIQDLLQSASTLRKGSQFSQAAAALHELKFLSTGIGENLNFYWLGRLEEAKLLRAQGQHEMAINLAEHISQNFHSNQEASNVHRLVGKWLAETRASNSRTILDKYLKRAVSLAKENDSTEVKSLRRQSQSYYHLARYADALYRSYEERLNSSEWQAAMRLRKRKKVELDRLTRRLKNSTKGEKLDYLVKIQELQRQLAMDKEEAEKLEEDRDNFLNLALEGYKHCLVIGDEYDFRLVFRLVSLWFSLPSRKNVIDNMLRTIDEVQSYKFIPLVYQIASRMGSPKDGQGRLSFQFAVISLVKKMAMDHPYHTIFQLLALANGDRIKDKQRNRNSFVVDMDKKIAAEELLKELTSYHGSTIRQMNQMVDIYIKLAELETKREDTNRTMMLPREIRGLRELELVPVVTSTFPIDRSCQYHKGSFPHFKGLGDAVTVMNGINAPKVVECMGSDGCKYRQLAKSGNDDLRQDAVMEQFFGLVNTFLQNNRDTWKRRLRIRTYKVVPFTPSAGVLEWVDGTLPLGDYLIGSMRNGGAHGRYGIGDWLFLKCREHMAQEKDKRKAFQEVCNNFRPVMHHFFLERFLQPADWFERRLAYTRSVATSSMVGYIVGLGDRHSTNILIDQATAEVVHIDLGVAFEQGLMLKTPERVPFRLTRDIVHGMGVTGVEGVFRRCCEETLSVMRMNKEALLTIVEVFIHDPLYKWALSPLKALQRQKDTYDDSDMGPEDSEEEYGGNMDAARALLRVKQKLDGYEGGEMRSVHGQVQQLIQDATDPERLCHMFPGWAAWL